ncbi:MAG: hypothetical protein ACR2FJ_08240 [Qipengyuania sp.]
MSSKNNDKSGWENEGGALRGAEEAVPEGITTRMVPEYKVGPYRYGDLDHARAELARQRNNLPTD